MSGHPEPGHGAFATLGRAAPDSASALLTSGRVPLSYAGLRELQRRTVTQLNELGIGRGARVAIVLPNGPEMAAAFLAIGAGATVAPLNPAYREEEFDFYLSDLGAQALVILEDMESPVRAVAERLGIPALELRPRVPVNRLQIADQKGSHGTVAHACSLSIEGVAGEEARPSLVVEAAP